MEVLVIAHICSNCMCCVVVQYMVQVELDADIASQSVSIKTCWSQ